jgi:signal transduction histidine kinase
MGIRQDLAFKFCLIVATLFILFAGSLYYYSDSYRVMMFDLRMKNKGANIATTLVDINPADSSLLRTINVKTKSAMFDVGVYIFDTNNKLLYNYTNDTISSKIKKEVLKIEKKSDIKFNVGKNEAIGFYYSVRGKSFKIIVSAYDKYGKENLIHLKMILLLSILLSIVVSYFAGLLFSGYALQPIMKIINDVDEINVSKLNIRLHESNQNDEIAKLSVTFNKMLDRLERGFEMQRSFISNASHELRTPLTSMNGHIEVTLKKERSTREYIELLNSLLDDIKSLNKISNNLLDLALVAADINVLQLKNIRVDEVLFAVRERLMKYFPSCKVSLNFVSFPTDEKSLIILGNEQLIESVFFNLMENACKYSVNNAVEVLFTVNDERIELSFKDNGIGIPASEISKIGEPFYRATNVKDMTGNGLGLSLTKKIMELHHGSVKITSEENVGTTVKVLFPIQGNFN